MISYMRRLISKDIRFSRRDFRYSQRPRVLPIQEVNIATLFGAVSNVRAAGYVRFLFL